MSQLEENCVAKQTTGSEEESSDTAVQNDNYKRDFRMPTPPPDWDYRCLLKDIAQDMTTENVKVAKSMFKGELKSQLSDRIEHAVDLFDILERRGFLDSNNLLYLQSLLFHAHRHDLFERVAKFASQTLQNAVYFQKPPDEPAPGYKYVKFHVKGQDFGGRYTRSSLEDLRSKAAKIMGLLPEHIFIPGIELCDSFIVTIMISEEHIDYLKTAVKDNRCQNDLASIGVDKIWTESETWDIAEGFGENEVVQSEIQVELEQSIRKLRGQLQKCQENLISREIEVLELKNTSGVRENNHRNISGVWENTTCDLL